MRTALVCTDRVRSFSENHEVTIAFSDDHTDNRIEADEAYVIGKRGQFTPVGAYLAGDEIIRIAVEHGVQMIHPGRLLSYPSLICFQFLTVLF